MKIQNNFLEEFSSRIFQNAEEFFRGIFQSQKNFLESFPESAIKNFKSGVRFFEEAQEAQGSYEEGGIRIQENRPKSGGREET